QEARRTLQNSQEISPKFLPNFFTKVVKDNICLVKSSYMAPKPNKEKGVASSSHGSKRSKRAN
ncbi:hypothetical protein HAX54_023068, partial [Datura stramonium]|nr:hypothetical protein [Datura stramonium]